MKRQEIFKYMTSGEMPDIEQVREKCLNQSAVQISAENKKSRKILLKPILIIAMCIILITTAVAATPFVLKMLGSDNIDFFSFALNNNNKIFYAGDYDLIKQYSSEVGITTEGNGYIFTVDNIAFDGTFLSVFFTVEKKADMIKEITAFSKKWNGQGNVNIDVCESTAVEFNSQIGIKIEGYELPLYGSMQNSFNDGYFVSEHEIKAVQRFTITDDLPDIFDIEITHFNIFDNGLMRMVVNNTVLQENKTSLIEKFYDRLYEKGLHISLIIDRSENKVEKLTVNPNISTVVQQSYYGNPTKTIHNITVNKVSISPLGNILLFTEAGANDESNKYLFKDFFIVDDKENIYRAKPNKWYRENPEEDVSLVVEFCGYVPDDAEYIKIIPFEQKYLHNDNYSTTYNYAHFDSLPSRIKYSDYGDVIVESAVVTDKSVTVTYRTEGMVDDDLRLSFDWSVLIELDVTYGSYKPIYDRSSDLYTVTYTFNKPIKNVREIITKIGTTQCKVELLEEQAIIIPLK